jgi:hypothetical protein
MCSCDWRIGTLYLYPNPLQCLIQLGLEDRYIPLVPRSTPMTRPAGIGGSVHFSCTQIQLQRLLQRGLEDRYTSSVPTCSLFTVTCCCVWRIGTLCLYPDPLQCFSQRGLEDRYNLSVPTYSLFTVACCCGWRIGTFYLYPDLLHGLTPT